MIAHILWIINQSGQLITQLSFTDPYRTGEMGLHPDSQLTLSSVIFSTFGVSQELTPNVPPAVAASASSSAALDCPGMTLIEMAEHNIHIYETQTCVKMVLITDSATTRCPPQLWRDLHLLYVDHVMKNPFHIVDEGGIGQPIRVPAFTEKVRKTIEKYSPPPPPPPPPNHTTTTTTTETTAATSSSSPSASFGRYNAAKGMPINIGGGTVV